MITVNIFEISNDGSKLNISVQTTVGNTITSIKLWTKDTYKIESQAIDITDRLSQTNNIEVIELTAMDLSVDNLEGIFFAQITSSDQSTDCTDCSNNIIVVAGNLSKYKEILLNKVLNTSICNNPDYDEIINLNAIIEAICISLEFGYYNEAITLYNTLEQLYSDDVKCSTCNNLSDPKIKTTLNFGILNNNLILK